MRMLSQRCAKGPRRSASSASSTCHRSRCVLSCPVLVLWGWVVSKPSFLGFPQRFCSFSFRYGQVLPSWLHATQSHERQGKHVVQRFTQVSSRSFSLTHFLYSLSSRSGLVGCGGWPRHLEQVRRDRAEVLAHRGGPRHGGEDGGQHLGSRTSIRRFFKDVHYIMPTVHLYQKCA